MSDAESARDAEHPGVRHLCVWLADLHGGGAERVMVQLAAGFAERGVRVDLVLANAVGPYLDEVPANVRVIDLGRRRVTGALRELVAYLRSERPDVLFTTLQHTSIVGAVARSLAWRLGGHRAALILREATTPSSRTVALRDVKTRVSSWAMRFTYAAADAVVAVSDGVAEDLVRSRGVPRAKIWTLFSPLVTPDVATKARAPVDHEWLNTADVPVVLGVGSLHPHKGYRTLLEAIADVRRRRPVRLVVLGEGPQRPELETHARELGVADHVDFVGFRPNPFAFMARASVFVLASTREGLPGALVQAMACGTPVVATDCRSGPAEILEDGAFGALVPVGDARSMATAIERALDAPHDAERTRARASKFASGDVIDAHVAAFDREVVRLRRP